MDEVLAHGPHTRDIGGGATTRDVLDAVLAAFAEAAAKREVA